MHNAALVLAAGALPAPVYRPTSRDYDDSNLSELATIPDLAKNDECLERFLLAAHLDVPNSVIEPSQAKIRGLASK